MNKMAAELRPAAIATNQNGTDISKNQSQIEKLPIRPLNPPIWGTSERLEVPQIGGFRGRISANSFANGA
jgi:hypothetical protein